MNGWVRHILLSSLWIVYLSCAEPVFYEQFQTIDSQWDKNKEYFFTYQIEDHSASYTMSLEIRNNNLYPYQNIWFFCSETQPEGTVLRDTIECVLADDFGKWYGPGISIYHLRLPIRKQHLFPQPGQYTFSIRQGMRDERLKGIEQIGLCIEKDL
jgi:gliding motility-associated lipoprotein GldH